MQSSSESQFPQNKKAKLAQDLVSEDNILSSSPDLHHKQPRSREQQENDDTVDLDESEDTGDSCGEEGLAHSNLYGGEVHRVVRNGNRGKTSHGQG